MTILTTIMKWSAVAALFAAVLLTISLRTAGGAVLFVGFIICAGALLVTLQAVPSRRYFRAAVFVTIAAVFNPIIPFERVGYTWIGVELAAAATFLAALTFWRIQETPVLSMPSITDRNPGSESL